MAYLHDVHPAHDAGNRHPGELRLCLERAGVVNYFPRGHFQSTLGGALSMYLLV